MRLYSVIRAQKLLLITYFEIVGCFQFAAHCFQLGVIDLLNLPQSLSHLVLPKLLVLGCRVVVRTHQRC